MSNPVRPIPQGYHSITPAITCKNASKAIDFYKNALGASEIMRMQGPGGMVSHAELRIGDSVIFVSDEFPGMAVAPSGSGPASSYLFLYTDNVDTVFNRAVSAGCRVEMPLDNMFWGDRYGKGQGHRPVRPSLGPCAARRRRGSRRNEAAFRRVVRQNGQGRRPKLSTRLWGYFEGRPRSCPRARPLCVLCGFTRVRAANPPAPSHIACCSARSVLSACMPCAVSQDSRLATDCASLRGPRHTRGRR